MPESVSALPAITSAVEATGIVILYHFYNLTPSLNCGGVFMSGTKKILEIAKELGDKKTEEQKKKDRETLKKRIAAGETRADIYKEIFNNVQNVGLEATSSLLENLRELSLEMTHPTRKALEESIQALQTTYKSATGYHFDVNPNTGIESARLNSGLGHYESVPQVRRELVSSGMTQDEKNKIEQMEKTILLLQKELEALRNTQRHKEKKEINLQSKPAGRKINPWNPVAYNILYDGNDDAERRAFTHWCKEQGIINPQKPEREAFKKAMKREGERRGRNG